MFLDKEIESETESNVVQCIAKIVVFYTLFIENVFIAWLIFFKKV